MVEQKEWQQPNEPQTDTHPISATPWAEWDGIGNSNVAVPTYL